MKREGYVALFYGTGLPFEVRLAQVRHLYPCEVLVRVKYTTLCGSDLHTYCGRRQEPSPVVLGHEIVGEVVEFGLGHSELDITGKEIKIGDTISWAIFCAPHNSKAPSKDIPQKSTQLFKYGHVKAEGENIFSGGLAEYCILKQNTAIVKISDQVPLKVAATINCAHATVAGALRLAGDVSNKKILVFGMGMLGLSCLAMCSAKGASWMGVVDKMQERLDWAKHAGATASYILPKNSADIPWPSVDIVFDMTGSPEAMELGLASLTIGGTAVWIGAAYPNKPVSVNAEHVVRKILQIKGLHNYNYDDFISACSFVQQHYQKFPFDELVQKEFSLQQINEAFEYATKNLPIRVGINMIN